MSKNIFIFLLLITSISLAQKTETYFGVAKNKSGAIVYNEKHEVVFSDKAEVLEAKTTYTREDGTVIGVLQSDFRKLLTAPTYTFSDSRDQSKHGLESDQNQVLMWKQDANKSREEKKYSLKDIPSSTLVVGCQGLHYYLVQNFEELKKKKEINLKYLIPGKLDDYAFTLRFESEDEKNIFISVKINNLFLKLFVSSLELKYRKSDKKLISYEGLSNIPSDSGDIQNVMLTYTYPSEEK